MYRTFRTFGWRGSNSIARRLIPPFMNSKYEKHDSMLVLNSYRFVIVVGGLTRFVHEQHKYAQPTY